MPFNGKVAYSNREYSYDNDVTQLIRHIIEFISACDGGNNILSMDNVTQEAVSQIVSATTTYAYNERENIINKNLRPKVHPYYSEYAHFKDCAFKSFGTKN